MDLALSSDTFAVCRLAGAADAVSFLTGAMPVFLAVTPDEVSLVCRSDSVPPGCLAVEDGWSLLRVAGTLDFGLVGVIAGIGRVLADAGIPVFVVSTYLTDYILVKAERLIGAVDALTLAGHRVDADAGDSAPACAASP